MSIKQTVKKHPFFVAREGGVVAIEIESNCWGVVRFLRGGSMEVLRVVLDQPIMPNIDWDSPPVGWVFIVWIGASDRTKVIELGDRPFSDESKAWAPPAYDPPSVIDNVYRIHYRGEIRKTTSSNHVDGMSERRRMTPEELKSFLKERVDCGEMVWMKEV